MIILMSSQLIEEKKVINSINVNGFLMNQRKTIEAIGEMRMDVEYSIV